MISSGAMEALGAAAAFADGEISGTISAFFTFAGSVPVCAARGFSTEASVSGDASGAVFGRACFFGVASSATGFFLGFVCAAAGGTTAKASKPSIRGESAEFILSQALEGKVVTDTAP